MKDVITFFEDYVKSEYELWEKRYTDSTGEKYEQVVAEFRGKTAYYLSLPSSSAGTEYWEEDYEKGKKILPKRKVRTIFMAKEYEHKKYGKVYRFYASAYESYRNSFNKCYYVAKIDSNYKVISEYSWDPNGNWVYLDGEELGELGDPLRTEKFGPPKSDKALEEYNAD